MHTGGHKRRLYKEIEPFISGRLAVGDGHELYYEQCGNPQAPAAVVLHGGPGGGCSPAMRRFFHPERWRVVLFDQRGCGRSSPHSSLTANTTQHLVDDLEALRKHLGIAHWTLFGGSWGSTLAIAYALQHRARVQAMILRGVFLLTPEELDWFYRGPAGARLPDAWQHFLAPLKGQDFDDPIAAYYGLLTSADRRVRAHAAQAWTAWESAAIEPGGAYAISRRLNDPKAMDALARIECHFFHHGGFLDRPRQLLEDAGKLTGLPGLIIQGEADLVTPPTAAKALDEAWADSQLHLVPGAGHAASEPGIIDGLVRATDIVAEQLRRG